MTGTAADAAAIFAAMLSQLKKLSDEQAHALASGTAEFRYVPKVLSRTFTQLTKLTEEELEQIATGEAAFKLIPKGYKVTQPAQPKQPKFNARDVHSALTSAPTQSAARDYLAGLELTAADYKKLAKELEVSVPSSAKGPDVVDTLVKVFVTGRLTTAAVRF